MFDAEFRSDFFGMLRSWHNNRALPTKRIWKQFDLALVTATEPYHLIANLNQSPFNVGEVLLLDDFTPEQVADLNHRHGLPLTRLQASQLMALLHGHPYLVRRVLYLVAVKLQRNNA
jgi:AAA-like domain